MSASRIAVASLLLTLASTILLLWITTMTVSMAQKVDAASKDLEFLRAELHTNFLGSDPMTLREVVDAIQRDVDGLAP